jgi:hypothetical protein
MDERMRARLLAGGVGVAAIVLAFALAGSILGPAGGVMIVALVACVAALAGELPLDAAAVAVLGAVLGIAASSAVSTVGWGAAAEWLPKALAYGVLAGAGAAAIAYVSGRSSRLRPLFEAVALVVIVAAMWSTAIGAATVKAADGSSITGLLSAAPPIVNGSPDEALFMNVLARVRQGQPYYPAYAQVIAEGNKVRSGINNLTSPMSYRLPTLYRMLALLPAGGLPLVIAMLVCGSLACVAAFALARKSAGPPLALAAAAGVAALFCAYSDTVKMLNPEPWAGALGLVAVALFAYSRKDGETDRRFLYAAVAVALLAALFRELAVGYLLVGLAVALALPAPRKSREWLPWVAALGVFAVFYGLHASAAVSAGRVVAPYARPVKDIWLHADGSGLVGAVVRYASIVSIRSFAGWAMLALALAGSWFASRRPPVRWMLIGCVAGGAVALFFLRPEGHSAIAGIQPGYWGDIVLPVMLACVPLAFAWLSRFVADRPS